MTRNIPESLPMETSLNETGGARKRNSAALCILPPTFLTACHYSGFQDSQVDKQEEYLAVHALPVLPLVPVGPN